MNSIAFIYVSYQCDIALKFRLLVTISHVFPHLRNIKMRRRQSNLCRYLSVHCEFQLIQNVNSSSESCRSRNMFQCALYIGTSTVCLRTCQTFWGVNSMMRVPMSNTPRCKVCTEAILSCGTGTAVFLNVWWERNVLRLVFICGCAGLWSGFLRVCIPASLPAWGLFAL